MKSILTSLFLYLLINTAFAAPILDQSFVPVGTQGSVISDPLVQAQSFTVGLDGQLVQVDLFVHLFASSSGPLPTDDLVFNLLETDINEVPIYSNSLASVSIMSSQLPTVVGDFFSIDLSGFNLFVNEGDVLALALESNQIRGINEILPGYTWGINGGNPYSGGNLFTTNKITGFNPTGSPAGSADVGFRTYVSVPEPSSFILMLVGFAFIGIRRKTKLLIPI